MRKYTNIYKINNSRKYNDNNLIEEIINLLPECKLKNNYYNLLKYILSNYINKLNINDIFKEREVINNNNIINIKSLTRYDMNIKIELINDSDECLKFILNDNDIFYIKLNNNIIETGINYTNNNQYYDRYYLDLDNKKYSYKHELIKDNIYFNILNSKLTYFYNKHNNSYYTIHNNRDYYDTYLDNSINDISDYYDFIFNSLEKCKQRKIN